MKIMIIVGCILTLAYYVTPPLIWAAGQSSDNYQIVQDVFSEGSVVAEGGVYQLVSVSGQQGNAGSQSGGFFVSEGGFRPWGFLMHAVPALSVASIIILIIGITVLLQIRKQSLKERKVS